MTNKGIISISDKLQSSNFHDQTNDALKDEDNVQWVMELPPHEQEEWITVLQWVRIPDRLLERDTFRTTPSQNNLYTFQQFLDNWWELRFKGKTDNSPLSGLFQKLKQRWEREQLSDENLEVWDLYLESLKRYIRPHIFIHDMTDYERALYGLSGTFFQTFPFSPKGYNRQIGTLGKLDQFFNNLRDLKEDTVRGICYFPNDLLRRFEIRREEIREQVENPDQRFINLIDYLLSNYAQRLEREVEPLRSTKGLHYSWEIMLKNVFNRYDRIENVFRSCGYNTSRFSHDYWDAVREYLPPELRAKFRAFKSTLKLEV